MPAAMPKVSSAFWASMPTEPVRSPDHGGPAAARFFDGVQPVARAVRVETPAEALLIWSLDGRLLGEWPWAGVRRVGALSTDRELRLAFEHASPRLVIEDEALARRVRSHLPQRTLRLWRGLMAALGVTAVCAAMAYGLLAMLPGLLAPHLPQALTRPLGDYVVRSLAENARVCAAASGQRALTQLMNDLGAAASRLAPTVPPLPDGPPLLVLDLPAINGFAVPGGGMVLTRGLVEQATPEALAGVLAHELGHLVLRHPEQSVVSNLGVRGVLTVLGATAGDATIFLAAGAELALLRHSRAQEREADAIGSAILAEAGIGTGGLAELLARLDKENGSGAGILDSHPGTTERIESLRRFPTRGRPALTPARAKALKTFCKQRRPLEEVLALHAG